MRVFCAVRHANDPHQFYGGLWSANFYPALRELGHEIVESQVDLLPTSRFMSAADGFARLTPEELEVRARTTERILEELRAALRERPVDLFLSYFYNSHFEPAGFEEIQRLGIPSVNFYCNSIHQFDLVSQIATAVDFSWHAERDARRSYLEVGARPVWVQMAADPNVYSPVAGTARKAKAVFVGQRYADRDRWMAAMIRANVPVDIYGPSWGAFDKREGAISSLAPKSEVYLGRRHFRPGSAPSYFSDLWKNFRRNSVTGGLSRVGRQFQYRREAKKLFALFPPHARGPIPFTDLQRVFSGYEVCLNFSSVWADGSPGSRLISHVRLRDFEAPMCRTCYLTGHTEEIAEFYEIGRELDTYETPEELVDKARFYLNHSSKAEALREAGYRRARRDHTWVCRFRELFRKTGLNRK